ncbi:protein CgeB [Peribacillus cavernae]|uniref:Protein CgeB n=1 Tax=Peribacillus cavernae TaxID=1674310 RepID=A0A3S0U3A5_9BACI|nr:glycosyltransferase [Peribacillus cavernae]MDQ0218925.1 spore maturation protein CgeB [Peribacillus cavernae]RUQ29362.1 protein CgeB [Peribacillus cavernae]
MNILYISSGYARVYQFFDSCILTELKKFFGVRVEFFTQLQDFSGFQLICNQFKPDIVFTLLGDLLPIDTLNWIKDQRFRSVLWLTEDPYYTDRSIKILPFFDIVFSIDSGAVDYYKSLQYKNVYHLPLGTDPGVFTPGDKKGKVHDICLVGYPYPDRIRLLLLLLKETPYQIQVVGNMWRKQFFAKATDTNVSLLNRWVHPSAAAHFYRSAKIVLNTHRPYDEKTNQNSAGIINRSINNRTFDIASCKSFQLIQYMDDLPLHFQEHMEIVSFQTNEELIGKLDYYLSNEEERQSIAANGRKKVLLQHTFHHRLKRIINGKLN